MTKDTFHALVEQTILELERMAKTRPDRITTCTTGELFELKVCQALERAREVMGETFTIDYTPNSHRFPDIVLCDGRHKYGIEVKSSSAGKGSGWKINGNSVMGTTSEGGVVETYIIFGKTARNQLKFRARRYEDCVANVVVTHSPRYLIDMDVSEQENFFQKSGISYADMTGSAHPITLITDYFRKQGLHAWWLTESVPADIRFIGQLSQGEQAALFGYGLAHFPELCQTHNGYKYNRLALYLAAEKSVVSASLRDNFSAGGRVSLTIRGREKELYPQLFARIIAYRDAVLQALAAASSLELTEDWGVRCSLPDDVEGRLRAWIAVAGSLVDPKETPGISPEELLVGIFAGTITIR